MIMVFTWYNRIHAAGFAFECRYGSRVSSTTLDLIVGCVSLNVSGIQRQNWRVGSQNQTCVLVSKHTKREILCYNHCNESRHPQLHHKGNISIQWWVFRQSKREILRDSQSTTYDVLQYLDLLQVEDEKHRWMLSLVWKQHIKHVSILDLPLVYKHASKCRMMAMALSSSPHSQL